MRYTYIVAFAIAAAVIIYILVGCAPPPCTMEEWARSTRCS